MTPQKILALQNFVGIFQKFLDFFSSNSEKNIIFRSSFSQKILLNDYDFWKIAKTLKKMSFKGLEKRPRIFSPNVATLRYLELACLPLYIN